MSAPGVSELIAWIRSEIAYDRARAEKENAATSVSDCLNAEHDPKDVLAVADAHEALLDFIESNARSTIELDATSGADVIYEMFWSLKGNTLLGHVAGAYRHRHGYDQAAACLAGAGSRVTFQLSSTVADDELFQRRLKRLEDKDK
ncbi:hypothetical protein ABZ345_47390 [Lentzea sp. NPDC005914]|uniref:hypothetical protein n=1 Tax=Lentzea sp. NPDC005914 TaxID=3154572 RepID=UPI003401FA7F